MRRICFPLLALGLLAVPAAGQGFPIGTECDPSFAPPGSPDVVEYRRRCLLAAQALVSAQPQISLLAAAGHPVLGAPGPGGLRLGFAAPVDLTLRLQTVAVRLPNLPASDPQALGQTFAVAAPAVRVDLAVGAFEGVHLSPRVRGVGSVDLLASLGALPFELLGVRGFETSAAALGIGARVGLVREGFATPGASLSLLRHWTGRVGFGNVCPPGEVAAPVVPVCPAPGSLGEFSTDARSWSGRAVVGRRFAGFGVTGGAGYDRFSGTGMYGFRTAPAVADGPPPTLRHTEVALRDGRWTVFANASYTHFLLTIAAEAGWMQGGLPIRGYEHAATDFDPRRGTVFGGLGARLAF